MTRFTLTAPQGLTPGQGEDFGETLAAAADAYLCALVTRTGGGVPEMDRRHVANLYRLAADALRAAKGASAGHQRRDRYAFRADGLDIKAADLVDGLRVRPDPDRPGKVILGAKDA